MRAPDRPTLPCSAPPPLVGRERELGVLRDHLAAAIGGRGSLVLIGGEAGIGKTALAEAACREAEQRGALVLVGRCYDLTETPPYGPWLRLFEGYQPGDDLPPRPTAFVEPGVVGAVTGEAALFRQVLDFLRQAGAQRPVVLLLDDAQWSDPASLDLLRFLGQSVAALPLLILVTYRDENRHDDHPLSRLVPALVREADAQRLDLRPLDDAAVRALVDARYGLPQADTGRLVSHLRARAEGNALYLGELLRALEESGVLRASGGEWALGALAASPVPPLLRQVIDARVARLDAESQRLLAVAAVIGYEAALAVWAAVGRVDEDALLDLTEHAEQAHILAGTPAGDGVQFAHALIREAVYERVPSVRRRVIHRAVASALIAQPHPDPDAVAHHLRRGGDPRASEWLVVAGERAARSYAFITAADRFEAALSGMADDGATERERGWLLYRIALMRRWTDPTQGIAHLEAAERMGTRSGDAALAALALCHRGMLRGNGGASGQGVAELAAGVAARRSLPASERARHRPLLTLLGVEDDSDGRGTLVGRLANVGRLAEARDLGEEVVAELAAMPARAVRGDALDGLAEAYAALGMPREAHDAAVRAQASYRAVGHDLLLGTSLVLQLFHVLLPYYPDHLAERRRVAAEAVEAWARIGGALPKMHLCAALPLMALEGQWDDVRRRALAARTENPPTYRFIARRLLAPIARAQGDAAGVWALVREAMPGGPGTEPGDMFVAEGLAMQRLAAMLALDDRDLDAARAWLEAHDRWLAWSGAVCGRAESARTWARYWAVAGDAPRAYQHARRALTEATHPRQPLALLAAHRTLGTLDTAAGHLDAAATHLDTALALADACAAPYERALTLLARADLAVAGGDMTTTAALNEAREICVPLGATLALICADSIAARSAAVGAAPAAPLAGLSARESEVLRLIAAGRTNREIADALFLSERTIEVHVRHILTKTDTANRTEAAAFALRHGLA